MEHKQNNSLVLLYTIGFAIILGSLIVTFVLSTYAFFLHDKYVLGTLTALISFYLVSIFGYVSTAAKKLVNTMENFVDWIFSQKN